MFDCFIWTVTYNIRSIWQFFLIKDTIERLQLLKIIENARQGLKMGANFYSHFSNHLPFVVCSLSIQMFRMDGKIFSSFQSFSVNFSQTKSYYFIYIEMHWKWFSVLIYFLVWISIGTLMCTVHVKYKKIHLVRMIQPWSISLGRWM